jgi:anti-sigma factor RsiW
MSDMKIIGDAELNAYLDGELDTESQAVVAAWLAKNPEEAVRLELMRRDKDLLANINSDILSAPIPAQFTKTIARMPTTPANNNHWMRAAAAIVLLLAGAAGGWFAHEQVIPSQIVAKAGFVDQAVSAHVLFTKERRHAVEAKAEEKHLVRWLSRRVGRTLNPPNLNEAGYKLVGGRLVSDYGRPAAQFMFQTKDRERLTLYVRSAPDEKETKFQIVEDRGVSAFYWIEKPYAYALIGKVGRKKLVALGEIVHTHLQSR